MVDGKHLTPNLSLDKPATPNQKQEFYKQAVEENGEFVDGMIRIFGKKIREVRQEFSGNDKKDRFFDAFGQMANDPKLIGGVIEGLFDFPKAQKRKVEDLQVMSKRCIELSLVAFPELQDLDKRGIAEGFLNNVSAKQGWDLNPKKIQQLAQQISKSTREVETTKSIRR